MMATQPESVNPEIAAIPESSFRYNPHDFGQESRDKGHDGNWSIAHCNARDRHEKRLPRLPREFDDIDPPSCILDPLHIASVRFTDNLHDGLRASSPDAG
jgi:hypothetical protein